MKVGKVNSKFVSTDIRFSAGYFLNDDAVNSRVIERNYANCIESFHSPVYFIIYYSSDIFHDQITPLPLIITLFFTICKSSFVFFE